MPPSTDDQPQILESLAEEMNEIENASGDEDIYRADVWSSDEDSLMFESDGEIVVSRPHVYERIGGGYRDTLANHRPNFQQRSFPSPDIPVDSDMEFNEDLDSELSGIDLTRLEGEDTCSSSSDESCDEEMKDNAVGGMIASGGANETTAAQGVKRRLDNGGQGSSSEEDSLAALLNFNTGMTEEEKALNLSEEQLAQRKETRFWECLQKFFAEQEEKTNANKKVKTETAEEAAEELTDESTEESADESADETDEEPAKEAVGVPVTEPATHGHSDIEDLVAMAR